MSPFQASFSLGRYFFFLFWLIYFFFGIFGFLLLVDLPSILLNLKTNLNF